MVLMETIHQKLHQGLMVEDPPDRFMAAIRIRQVVQAKDHSAAARRIPEIEGVKRRQAAMKSSPEIQIRQQAPTGMGDGVGAAPGQQLLASQRISQNNAAAL